MTDDANKSELTKDVTRAAISWLDEKGFKPIETEVCVCIRPKAWIADLAAVITPTQTELINLKLIRRPPNFNFAHRDTVGYRQRYEALRKEWTTEYNKIVGVLTAIVEVKTSVADFRRETKWQRNEQYDKTNLRYVAMPTGMIDEKSWPDGWGILLYGQQKELIEDSKAPSLRCVRPSTLFSTSLEQSRSVILQIAVRRDHATRYARQRDFDRKMRVEDGERKSITRIQSAISFVLRIADGHSVEDAQSWTGIRYELPEYVLERIRDFQKKVIK